MFLAVALKKLNRFEEALQFYDFSIQRNPENADYYLGKGLNL